MAIFLGSTKGAIATSRIVEELVGELDSLIAEQAAYQLPEQHVSFLGEFIRELHGEREWEERINQSFQNALTRLAASADAAALRQDFDTCSHLAVEYFVRRGSVLGTHHFCTESRDLLVRSAIRIAELQLKKRGLEGPQSPHAWCAMGSYGRKEATFTTPCDLMLVQYDDHYDSSDWFARLGEAVATILRTAGLSSTSGITPDHEIWRGSITSWRERFIEQIFAAGQPSEVVLFTDLRLVSGSEELAERLRTVIGGNLSFRSGKVQAALHSAASLPLGFDFFGRLRVEKSGSHRGKFNLLEFALTPLVQTIQVLSVRSPRTATETVDRIRQLQEAGDINVDLSGKLLRAYHEFTRRKLILEVGGIGNEPTGFYFDPHELSHEEESRFKQGLEAVFSLQRIVLQGVEA